MDLVNQLVVAELAKSSGKVLAVLMPAVDVPALVPLERLLGDLHLGSELLTDELSDPDGTMVAVGLKAKSRLHLLIAFVIGACCAWPVAYKESLWHSMA